MDKCSLKFLYPFWAAMSLHSEHITRCFYYRSLEKTHHYWEGSFFSPFVFVVVKYLSML